MCQLQVISIQWGGGGGGGGKHLRNTGNRGFRWPFMKGNTYIISHHPLPPPPPDTHTFRREQSRTQSRCIQTFVKCTWNRKHLHTVTRGHSRDDVVQTISEVQSNSGRPKYPGMRSDEMVRKRGSWARVHEVPCHLDDCLRQRAICSAPDVYAVYIPAKRTF